MFRDSYHTLWAIFWITFAAVVTVALFTVSGCAKEEAKLENQVKISCIQKGGNWVMIEQGRYGCQFK